MDEARDPDFDAGDPPSGEALRGRRSTVIENPADASPEDHHVRRLLQHTIDVPVLASAVEAQDPADAADTLETLDGGEAAGVLEEMEIARTTTGTSLPTLEPLMKAEEITAFQELTRRIPVPEHIYQYAVRLVRQTRPQEGSAPDWLKPLVSWGAGPRAVQYLILGGKTRAALSGQYMVRLEDIQAVAEPVLTHRMITTFAAQSEGIDARKIVKRLVQETTSSGLPPTGTASARG